MTAAWKWRETKRIDYCTAGDRKGTLQGCLCSECTANGQYELRVFPYYLYSWGSQTWRCCNVKQNCVHWTHFHVMHDEATDFISCSLAVKRCFTLVAVCTFTLSLLILVHKLSLDDGVCYAMSETWTFGPVPSETCYTYSETTFIRLSSCERICDRHVSSHLP